MIPSTKVQEARTSLDLAMEAGKSNDIVVAQSNLRTIEAAEAEKWQFKESARLKELKAKLTAVGDGKRLLRVKIHAARQLLSKKEAELLSRFKNEYFNSEIDHVDNAQGNVLGHMRGETGQDIAALRAFLAFADSDAECKEAVATVDSFLAEVEAQRADDEKAQLEMWNKLVAVEETKKAAIARAIAEAEKSPEVLAAEKAFHDCQGKCHLHLTK